MPQMLARVLLGLVAVSILAWGGVLLRDHRVSSAAAPLLYEPGLSRSQFERNIERLEDARLLNPDSALDLARAQVYLVRGRRAQAARVARELLRSEPDNVAAWRIVMTANRGVDPEAFARAAAEVRRLNPLADF